MMAFRRCGTIMVVMLVVAALRASATANTASSSYAEEKEESLVAEESSHGLESVRLIRKIATEVLQSSDATVAPRSMDATKATRTAKKMTTPGSGRRKIVGEANDLDRVVWDDGLAISSAGNGREKTSTTKGESHDEEEAKTLSQQVKEGKYGLIQNEIYPKPPRRPGIISYLGNPEVPKDNAKNLGGLEEDEIWLAENHLLVLRGGKFPEHGTNRGNDAAKWPPIDDYKAPPRQVKIPERPQVPPPFPIQLAEGGPVQIIGANGSRVSVNYTEEDYPSYSEGFFPGEAPFYPPSSINLNLSNPTGLTGDSSPGNQNLHPQGLPDPFYHALPPGAVFLPPPANQSDYDEDDQSIYYPPPYSFQYRQENSTPVPPGPLVPGIILPPPPNFFAPLEEKKPTTKRKYKRPTTTPLPTETPSYSTSRKTPARPRYHPRPLPTTTPTIRTSTPARIPQQTPKVFNKFKSKTTPGIATSRPTTLPIATIDYPETTTTPRPEIPTTLPQPDYYNVRSEIENTGNEINSPTVDHWSQIVKTTAVPLVAYYEQSTSRPLEHTPSPREAEVAPVHVEASITNRDQARYYFYKETNNEEATVTTTPRSRYYKTSTESPYYKLEPVTIRRQPKKQYYSVEMIPSQQTANDYNIDVNSFGKQSADYGYSQPDSSRGTTKSRIQSQRVLVDPSYQPLSVNTYYTTQRPQFYYQTSQSERYDTQTIGYRGEPKPKSNPVYQYSFEAADYSKQPNRQTYAQEPILYEDRRQPTDPESQYYDIETDQAEGLDKGQIPSSNDRPAYASTPQSLVEPTPNPLHAYYTKQDEQLLDDVTKQYFTLFGKKLPEKGIESTTPLYRIGTTTTESPIVRNHGTYSDDRYPDVVQPPRYSSPKVRVHYGDQTQRPFSLKDDTLVNYGDHLPPINPDAEFISITEPSHGPPRRDFGVDQLTPVGHRPTTNYVPASVPRETYRPRYPSPISLKNDIAINYQNPRPPLNPDAEFIDPVPLQKQTESSNPGGSYFAYKLPGNGGHFYFLTPQAISQRQDVGGGYLYPKPTGPRLIRRRRGRSEG